MSLKHAILVLLETEPGSGYDLLKHFNNSLGYFWNAKHQQIYLQLKKLRDEGLITCDLEKQKGKPDKKIYSITREGEKELAEWLRTPVAPNSVNDALLVKIYGGRMCSPEELIEELDRHAAIHQKTLDKLTAIEQSYLSLKPESREKYRLPYLTLRRGILGENAWLEWAKEARREITKS
ncbi:MAG: PadR family transcriptional regulator [Oleiphilus sp.]|nr:MAG: PadR family transcriptional regulator [Oleiphilus sp.]